MPRIIISLMLWTLIINATSGVSVVNASSVELDHVDGLLGPKQIPAGVPITFHFKFVNNSGYNILGSTNGIRLSSVIYWPWPMWSAPFGAWSAGIETNYFDLGVFVNYYSANGISPDTIGFAGVRLSKPGIPNGYNNVVFTITTTFYTASVGKSVRLDSCSYSPSGVWWWSTTGGTVYPSWSGPYTYIIVYLCGNANGDGNVNVGDAVFLINYVFKSGTAPDPLCVGDANGDANVNVGDAVYLINYVFKGGPAPNPSCCP